MQASCLRTPIGIFLAFTLACWVAPQPAAAENWAPAGYDAGRAGVSPDILPENLVRIWDYDFYLALDEEAPSDSEEPPPKPTPQELQAAITESNLFFEEGERTLPRTDTGEEIWT